MNAAARLLIDAGNSRVKWSLIADDGTAPGGAFEHERADAAETAVPAEWSALPKPLDAWISNVAGDAVARRIDRLIDARWPGLPRTTIRAQARQCGVTNCYEEPSALGSDRWAGLIGARAAFPGENLLIATFGTATTLEALCADGTFTGGLCRARVAGPARRLASGRPARPRRRRGKRDCRRAARAAHAP